MTEPFVDAQTVAGFLGVTDRWVRDHASPSLPDRLPVYEIGAHLRFRLSEVEAWVAARRRGCEPASNVVSLRRNG